MNKEKSDYRYLLGVIIALICIGWACSSYGDTVQLQSVEMRYQRYVGEARDPLFVGTSPSAGWQLGANVGVLDVAGVEAAIVAGEDTAFHYGGLRYFAFVRVVPQVQIGWAHQSLHLFDGAALPDGFPLYNAVEVRLKLYDAGPKAGALF